VVYRHAAHTDLPDGGTGKTCLGGVCTVPELLVCATSVPNVVQMFSLYILSTFFAFNALTLLVWHQEEHPACKNGVIRCWHGYLSGVRCN